MAEKIDTQLEEGIYKVKQLETYFFMKVIRVNESLLCSIAGGFTMSISQLNERFPPIEIIKKLTPLDRVVDVRVTVNWSDVDGHTYKMETNNSRDLERLFDHYPQLLQDLKFPL